jgi:hypothetical protein
MPIDPERSRKKRRTRRLALGAFAAAVALRPPVLENGGMRRSPEHGFVREVLAGIDFEPMKKRA